MSLQQQTMSSSAPKKESSKGAPPRRPFMGKLQPVTSRAPAVPDVNYAKGGSDFRCPNNVTSLGRQVLSGEHLKRESRMKFGKASRFTPSDTVGIGPAGAGPQSSMRRQVISKRQSAGSVSFGTSSRVDAWKTYTVYTAKHT